MHVMPRAIKRAFIHGCIGNARWNELIYYVQWQRGAREKEGYAERGRERESTWSRQKREDDILKEWMRGYEREWVKETRY